MNSEKLRAFGDKLHNSFLLRSESLKKAQLFGQPSSLLPQKRIRVLKILALISYIVMLAMQFYCVLSFKGVPIGDAWRYTRDAMECHNAGVWYPMTEDFDVRGGLAGTGLVNWMVLLFRITTNMKIVYFFNILFVQVILFCTLYLAKKITHSDTILYPTAILFCMFGTFWSEVCIARTEILFTALAFASLALAIKRSRLSVIASGFLLCLANWVRPLGISFFIAILWLFLVLRSRPMVYVRFVAAFCAGVLLCSFWNYYNGGVFSYQPSVASGNLLMGCNEDADGSYSKTVFYPGHVGYIPDEEINSMTFKEINKVYSDAAKKWIRENPEKFLMLMPKKLFYMYITETYSGEPWFDNTALTSGRQYIDSLFSILKGEGDRSLEHGDIIMMYTQGFYMLTLALFLIGVVWSMKKGYWRSMSFLYGIVLIATAMCMITVGAARYHFPYLPIMFITAAAFVDSRFIRKNV
ncbi:MAG TPA: hypothetical protein DDY98_06305 [Ruminococcaceae bacterium]|nr:hypothetical protein [Oscillospiraceae bacterium]